MYISREKRGTLDIVSAAVMVGGTSPGWHGAWRWVVITFPISTLARLMVKFWQDEQGIEIGGDVY